ncbi:hypothetical protein Droror1_Dr00001251 [Drosera rotundifolia]
MRTIEASHGHGEVRRLDLGRISAPTTTAATAAEAATEEDGYFIVDSWRRGGYLGAGSYGVLGFLIVFVSWVIKKVWEFGSVVWRLV